MCAERDHLVATNENLRERLTKALAEHHEATTAQREQEYKIMGYEYVLQQLIDDKDHACKDRNNMATLMTKAMRTAEKENFLALSYIPGPLKEKFSSANLRLPSIETHTQQLLQRLPPTDAHPQHRLHRFQPEVPTSTAPQFESVWTPWMNSQWSSPGGSTSSGTSITQV